MAPRIRTALFALFAFLLCLQTALCQDGSQEDQEATSEGGGEETVESGTRYISIINAEGEQEYVAENRRPSLYTSDFGDCMGPSQVNITRFDAAYYKDNSTVSFQFEGSSAFFEADTMIYIGVFAYGESRFELLFNPCGASIFSVPIQANGIIPVSDEDVAGIPSIAMSIPDFEGEAILRIFANATQSEIGCYAAQVINGNSFSHPKSVGTVLGIFTFIALVASFATAVYGAAVPTMRLHYAHSLSVGVVFSVFQHIYFTGALSVNWPSVLVAWWSNFAWSAGMIHSSIMQSSIDSFVGNVIGNTSHVGAAAGTDQTDVAGGFDIATLYKRTLPDRISNHPGMRDMVSEIFNRDPTNLLRRDVLAQEFEELLQRRQESAVEGSSDTPEAMRWFGDPVESGLPLPGNFSGFAGTVGQQGIRVSNAFMTGFLWFLILVVIMVAAVIAFKWILEAFARFKIIKSDRLKFFRDHWLGYTAVAALRIFFLAWFMMMFLTMFQFTYDSNAGVKAVAAIVFVIFIVGVPGLAAYAIWYKYRVQHGSEAGHAKFERKKLLGTIPWFAVRKHERSTSEMSQSQPAEKDKSRGGVGDAFIPSESSAVRRSEYDDIHDNEDYIKRFGWLAARFRRSRWWFFAAFIVYQFLEAVFYAGASGNAPVQVFGLLAVEFLAFCFIIWARPFEGRRLNVLVVYCLGFSKVASVALSAAFDNQFALERIPATAIGIVIIVIQGILTILTLIAIVVGAISSWMSISRNREQMRPRKWHGMREKYFDHLDRVANDLPHEPKPKPDPEKERAIVAEKTGFEVRDIHRLNKIEDDDPDFAQDLRTAHGFHGNASRPHSMRQPQGPEIGVGVAGGSTTPYSRRSRTASIHSNSATNLPFGARPHRPSWSTRDFRSADDPADEDASPPIDLSRSVPEDAIAHDAEPTPAPTPKSRRSRTNSAGKAPLRPQMSSDSHQVGADVSTRDNIGRVPAPPPMRPRSNTGGSIRSRSGDDGGDDGSRRGSQRNSRVGMGGGAGTHGMLTPALERDEWISPHPAKTEERD